MQIVNTATDVTTLSYFDFFIVPHALEFRMDFNQIITRYMNYVASLACEAVVSSMHMFENNYRFLLTSLQIFINKYLANEDNYVALISLNIMDNSLRLIWDLTDKIPLVPIFVNIGCVENALQWVCTDVFASHIAVLGPSIFSIIYNLSRNTDGLKRLQTKEAFNILIKCKHIVDHENSTELTNIFGMTLISLATNRELEENKEFFFVTGETLYNGCKKAEQSIDLRDNGLHLSESLELLYRVMFNNTHVMKHILDNKTNESPAPVGYFVTLFLSFYGTLLDPEPGELEKRVAKCSLKILRKISRDPDYQKQLTQNNEFCIIIECLASHPKQYVANAIYLQIQSEPSPSESTLSDIYISCDWNDQGFCQQFVKELRRKISKPILVDDKNVELDDDTWEHSSVMIDSAVVVIILASTAYAENTDKFQELSYITSTCNKSRNTEKRLIVVEAEPDFSFNGFWMSNLLRDEPRIPYEDNISKMASKVCKIVISKKSPIKCLPCRNRNVGKTTAERNGFSSNSETKALKSTSIVDSNLPFTKATVQKKLPNTTDDFDILISTARHVPYSIVTRLLPQTGSADPSTWV